MLIALVAIFLGCLTPKIAAQEQPLTFNDIKVKLRFTSKINSSTREINKMIISLVKERKAGFKPTKTEIAELRSLGADDELLKALDSNLSTAHPEISKKPVDPDLALYTANYRSQIPGEIKIAIDAGHQYVMKHGGKKESEAYIR